MVETENGAGSVINARRFSLVPRELPELVRRLLASAEQQSTLERTPQTNRNYGTGFGGLAALKKKRQDESYSSLLKLGDESNLNRLKKREVDTDELDDVIKSKDFADESETSVDVPSSKVSERADLGSSDDSIDKLNDQDLDDSMKNLRRRDELASDEVSSLADNDGEDAQRKMLLRSDGREMDEAESLEDSSEYSRK